MVELGRTLVGHGTHNLLSYSLLVVAEVDAVAFRLTHLTASIQTGHLNGFVGKMERLRLLEILDVIYAIEATCKQTRHLHILFLIFTYRHLVCLVHQDVRSHQAWISQQTCIDIIGLLAHLLLERCNALQLTQISVHIQIEIQLQHLLNIALNIYRSLLGINSASEIFAQDSFYRVAYIIRRRMGGQRVPIGDEEHAVVFVLHLHETLDRSEIVTKVQIARRTYSANDSLHYNSIGN